MAHFFYFLETLTCSYCRGISIEIHLVIIYFLYNLEHLYLNNDTKYSEDFMAAAIQQRAELQRRIWQIANDVRGSVDGWDFKQYVLGTLFYRFISENFANYIEGGDDSVDYSTFNDDDPIIASIKEDTIKAKGYFIYPSQLFKNVVATANTNPNLNTDLKKYFYRY